MKKKKEERKINFWGMDFSLEWTSLAMDISLFAFFCTKTFLGQLAILEYIAFAAFIGFTIVHVLKFRKKHGLKPKTKVFFIWYGAFALFAALSILWALSAEFVLKVLPSVIALSVFAVAITYYAEDKNQLNKVIHFYLVSNLLAAVIILIGFPFVEGVAAKRVGIITGIAPNTVLQTISLSVIIAVYYAIKKKEKKYLALAILAMIAVVLSASRKAILVSIVGVATLFIIKKKSKHERRVYACFFILLICIIGAMAVVSEGFRTEMTGLFTSFLPGHDSGDWSVYLRNFFRDTAISLWQQRPLIGSGLNNFAYYVANDTWYTKNRYAHDNYVELLADLGLIGTILYYLIYVYVIVKIVRLFKNKKDTKANVDFTFVVAMIISLAMVDYGAVSYSGVMYNVIIFVIFYLSNYSIEDGNEFCGKLNAESRNRKKK